jgi:hypothetical protein
MEPSVTPCELCGDVTPGAARYDDPDQGWDALCLACWQLQQPPDPDQAALRDRHSLARVALRAQTTAETLRAALVQATRAAQLFAAVWQVEAHPEDEGDTAP